MDYEEHQKKNVTVATFKHHQVPNKAKSRDAGRPIYDDMEVVELRYPADKLRVSVFPAHAEWKTVATETGTETITYAMRFNEQYKRFKANEAQVVEGTPLDELPFLTQGKRMELKALSIYTAEALASLEGQRIKNLGMGGRELVNQAKAYIEAAENSAGITAVAAENAALKEQLELMRAELANVANYAKQEGLNGPEIEVASEFSEMDDDALKARIKELSGEGVRGNPKRETLERMLAELQSVEAA